MCTIDLGGIREATFVGEEPYEHGESGARRSSSLAGEQEVLVWAECPGFFGLFLGPGAARRLQTLFEHPA
jgi:hypothetical protein